ncbi:MAG: hypothetical protein WD314_10655 [Trueperaceae bacterium]
MKGLDVGNLQKDAVTQGAETGEARLAGLPGRGTLQVWRGRRHDVIRILGTWRRQQNSDDLATLREAMESAQPIIYEGFLDDPANVDRQEVRAEVVVSSISSYQLGGRGEEPYCFVNFLPREPEEVAT